MSMIKAFLVDPYRCEIRHCEVEDSISVWHHLLRCDCCDVRTLLRGPHGTAVDVWFDDEFLLKHEVLDPSFRFLPWGEGECPVNITGYGLICGSDSEGASVSVNEEGFRLHSKQVEAMLRIQFERWQKRLKTDDFIDQLLRTPETEPDLVGKFRYLDNPQESATVRGS